MRQRRRVLGTISLPEKVLCLRNSFWALVEIVVGNEEVVGGQEEAAGAAGWDRLSFC